MYEIYTREKGQHRVGHLSFRIGGLESELTLDPTQYMPTAMAQALSEGAKPGEETAGRAMDICVEMARQALVRKIGKLKRGLQPGGMRLDAKQEKKGFGIDAFTAKQLESLDLSEGNAIEAFLNRGWLRGLTREERDEVHQYRKEQKVDNDADWQARRQALSDTCMRLIAEHEEVLKGLKRRRGEVPAEFEGRKEKINSKLRALRQELEGYKGPFAASHGFQYAYTQYLTKQIDLVNDTIKIWPLMTNTTLDTVRDAVDQFQDVTADEFDGSGYSSGGWALAGKAVAVDDANDRAEFDANDYTATALGAGTRSIQGVALGKFNTSTALSCPLHWIEYSSNKTPDGSDFTNVFNAEGILQAADG